MSDFNQDQEGNYQNIQNNNNNPNNQTVQYQPENNIQINTPQKSEINDRISDVVEPLVINSDTSVCEPMTQLSEQPINEVEEDSQVQQMIPVNELEQPGQQQPEIGCRLAIRHIIMIIIIIILLILIIVFATMKKK